MSREPTLDSISELPEEDGRLQRLRQEAEEVAPDLSEDYSTADELARTGEADLSHTSSDDESRAGTPSLITYLKKAGRPGTSPLASKVSFQVDLQGRPRCLRSSPSSYHPFMHHQFTHLPSICPPTHQPIHSSIHLLCSHPSPSIYPSTLYPLMHPFIYHPSTHHPSMHPLSITILLSMHSLMHHPSI